MRVIEKNLADCRDTIVDRLMTVPVLSCVQDFYGIFILLEKWQYVISPTKSMSLPELSSRFYRDENKKGKTTEILLFCCTKIKVKISISEHVHVLFLSDIFITLAFIYEYLTFQRRRYVNILI